MTNQIPDTETLGALMAELRPALHRYAARMMGSVIDGEDVVQDVYLRAASAIERGHVVERPRAWLFRIAHTTALNHIRTRKAAREVAEKMHNDATPQDIPPPDMSVRDNLANYMALTPAQRSVAILFDVFGYSAAEVAELTEGTVSSVKSTLHRARAALKRGIEAGQTWAPLGKDEAERLTTYARLFNARAFDELRDMLAAEVTLDVVSIETREGSAAVGNYFSNYEKLAGWRMVPGMVEGAPALLGFDGEGSDAPDFFVLVDIDTRGVRAIRDFRYARYALADAAWGVIG